MATVGFKSSTNVSQGQEVATASNNGKHPQPSNHLQDQNDQCTLQRRKFVY